MAKEPADEFELPLRVTVVRPPPGVRLCMQGKDADDLVGATTSTGDDVSFDVSVLVKPAAGAGAGGGAGASPRLLGRFVQGPPDRRFLYVCSGTLAGQPDSPWTRRAKVDLSTITPALVARVRRGSAGRLESRFHGTAGDGGPACASVPLLNGGWRATT